MNKYLASIICIGLLSPGCGRTKYEYFVGEKGPQGEKGDQGETGPQGVPGEAAVVGVIDPCGDYPGVYDEVVLRLANGQLLSSFSDNANGKNTRFSILTQGSYTTTDGSNCHFTVTASGDIL